MNAIRDHLTQWRPTKEEFKTFMPLWEYEMNRFGPGSKLKRFQDKWLNGKMFE
jgi:hypothetical protein